MSIYEIPKQRFINTETYPESLTAALGLLQKETPPISERRQMIIDLLNLVNLGDENDQDVKDEAVRLTSKLLLSDPLTDQQAGAVARYLRLTRTLDLWPLSLEGNGRHFHLEAEEMIEIMTGDWEAINQIFSRFPERSRLWHPSLRKIETSSTPKTVYRMLELHPDDIAPVRQFGMIPEGLHRYVNLSSVLAAQLQHFLNQRHLPYNLFLSKANLLIENWEEWESVPPSPFKLGLATTTEKNIRHRGSVFLGSYIFEIVLPANRLIAAPRDGLPEDERTVLFYIEPKAIKAVYQIEPISPLSTWGQIQRQKSKH
ncbi:hypothetical protein HYU90_00500 [Candidatus Collierbacteria bacterium]|nr:hypothetical protein [Candidatus Collierbacteria bacterium]